MVVPPKKDEGQSGQENLPLMFRGGVILHKRNHTERGELNICMVFDGVGIFAFLKRFAGVVTILGNLTLDRLCARSLWDMGNEEEWKGRERAEVKL